MQYFRLHPSKLLPVYFSSILSVFLLWLSLPRLSDCASDDDQKGK
jgi:hypothetical protein